MAAWRAGVPVVASAIHSTGWPDGIGRLNRKLTRITDAFIGVAKPHGQHLTDVEGFPSEKVFVIPNGVDTQRFRRLDRVRSEVREELGLNADAKICGIVAALRPEKNHVLFLRAAKLVAAKTPEAQFVIVGDGPERAQLEATVSDTGLTDRVHFLGSRNDVHRLQHRPV